LVVHIGSSRRQALCEKEIFLHVGHWNWGSGERDGEVQDETREKYPDQANSRHKQIGEKGDDPAHRSHQQTGEASATHQ
jgi:hypothetical protein